MEILTLGIVLVIGFVILRVRSKQKRRQKKINGAIAVGKLLRLGAQIDGDSDEVESTMLDNQIRSLGQHVKYEVEWSDKDINKIMVGIREDQQLNKLCEEIKSDTDLQNIAAELDSILENCDSIIEKADNKKDRFLKEQVIRFLAALIGSDFEFLDSEVKYFHLVKRHLDVSDEAANTILSERFLHNRKSQLDSFKVIPLLTQKVIDYIDNEFEDLQELRKMSPDELRNNIPGVSKPVANAILRKLNAFYKISSNS